MGMDLPFPLYLPLTPRSIDVRLAHLRGDAIGIMPQISPDFGDKGDISSKEHLQVRSVRYIETGSDAVVYANSKQNVLAAVDERITKRQLEYKGTPDDRSVIGTMVRNSIISTPRKDMNGTEHDWGVFHRTKIEKWVTEYFHMEDLKSSKWSAERMEKSLDRLRQQYAPEWKCKAAIKAEPMPPGKAPRLLIADGDEGQIMALVVVKCFEDLLFEHFKRKSIKHRAKGDAINAISKMLHKRGGQVIEGDGSAWDACCNQPIRDQIENPVLKHVMECVMDAGVVPAQWHIAHDDVNLKPNLKLFFKNKYEKLKVQILSIRRSGHRGTSCLNWWVNYVLWHCCLYQGPSKFLSTKTFCSLDRWNQKRWLASAFEGDDSILSTHAKTHIAEHMEEVEAFWKRQGFHMKLFVRSRVAKFCGVHLRLDEGTTPAPSDTMPRYAPELTRCLQNIGISVCPDVVSEAMSGEFVKTYDILSSALMSRALGFAGIYPTVSRALRAMSREFGDAKLDHEGMMSHFGKGGGITTEEIEAIFDRNSHVTPSEEIHILGLFGYPTTDDDLVRVSVEMRARTLTGGGFGLIIPASWRTDPSN